MNNTAQAGRGLRETCQRLGVELLATAATIVVGACIISALVAIGAHTGILGCSMGLEGYLIYPLLGSTVATAAHRLLSHCPSAERVGRAARGLLTQAQQQLLNLFRIQEEEARAHDAQYRRLRPLEIERGA